jgi:AraC-like DNA-binding protein
MDARFHPAKGERGIVSDGFVRLGPMLAWPRVLDEFGVDTEGLLAAVGLERGDFGDPETVVSFRSVDMLLRRSAAATGCDHLGVLIGREGTLSSLGAVGFLMQASPSVGDALGVLQRHLQVQDRGAVVEFDVDGDSAYLRYLVVVGGLAAVDQIYAIAGLVGCNLMKALCGARWRPTEVQLPFSPPRDRPVYRDAFDAPLRFDADRLTIVFPAAQLAWRPPTADPLLWRMMSERVRQLEAALHLTWPDQVRRVLRSMIFDGGCSPTALAQRLGTSPRSLHRRLAAAGTTVRKIRDEVWADAACQLLASTGKSATEIATVLGYSEASAFTRAFRRWRGVGPAQWRAALEARAH